MKKRIAAMLLALTVISSTAACGGKAEEPVSVSTEKQIKEPAAEELTEEKPAEETSRMEDISDWTAYEGVLDDGGTIFYCYNVEGTRAAFIYLSADRAKSVSIIGNYTYDGEEGIGYIADETSGAVLADRTIDNGDGTYTVDLGEQGTAVIMESDPQKVIDTMNIIQAGTEDAT